MNCTAFEERIALWAGGDLGSVEASEVERHLESCPGCARFAEEMRECRAALVDLRTEPISAAAFARVRRNVLERLQPAPKRAFWWRPVWAAVLATLLVAVVLWMRPRDLRVAAPVADVPPAIAEAKPPAPPPAETPPPVRARKSRRLAPSVALQAKAIPTEAVKTEGVETEGALAVEPVRSAATPEPQQLVIKILTDDPNVVIYWIAEQAGD
jgi:hypothetical protein